MLVTVILKTRVFCPHTFGWNVLLDAAPSQSVWEYTDGTDGRRDTRQMRMGFLIDMARVITNR